MPMRITVLGCGDAFGSGGRLNTCFYFEGAHEEDGTLLDCGASALISMRRFNVNPNCVSTILLTHLHADHFGGLPGFILDAQFGSRRSRPLVIAGPAGLESRLMALMEAHFPGSSTAKRKFETRIIELEPYRPAEFLGIGVTAFPVSHPSGTPSLGLRVAQAGLVVAYTGDTEWTDTLFALGQDADLLLTECYTYDRKVPYHLDYLTLQAKVSGMGAKRVVLTHMSEEMLARVGEIEGCEAAFDGMTIDLV